MGAYLGCNMLQYLCYALV